MLTRKRTSKLRRDTMFAIMSMGTMLGEDRFEDDAPMGMIERT
jgi:hypothetical protein